MTKKKSNFRKGFRKNKRIKHPTYVVDSDGNVFKYIGITHANKTNEKDNVPLKKNPNPKDDKPAYIRPYIENDKPQNFGRRYKDWSFAAEDKKKVQRIIDENKKPRK